MRLQQWRVLKLRKFNYLGENIKGLHLLCSFQSEKGKTKQQQQNPHKKTKTTKELQPSAGSLIYSQAVSSIITFLSSFFVI